MPLLDNLAYTQPKCSNTMKELRNTELHVFVYAFFPLLRQFRTDYCLKRV